MNKSKRFFVCFFIAIFVMTTVTACGGNTSVAIPATEETVDQNAVDYQGEGQVQGGIKSDDEIAALQEEEQQYIDNNTTEYESNEGHEPESFGSGNFQDYWQGEAYFDFVGYMNDNGYHRVFPENPNGEKIKDGETAEMYECYKDDEKWIVAVENDTVLICQYNYEHMSSIIANDDRRIAIDNTGMTMSMDAIITLDAVVQAIAAHVDEEDPLQYTQYNYNKMY
ncbi:hypothetical protein J6X90_01985 [Candidatus Saccharibacteria bacterium]|nr:hypothetical protein [Candidatus Saccharibacteria bacterium]